MARLARLVVPGVAHHVMQRGNRRMPVFLRPVDYACYLAWLREECARFDLAVWGYCLMTNHVHLITVPATERSLRGAIGETHRRYATAINARECWTGYLWQGRFASSPMEETYLIRAFRYVERNPVRAGIAAVPWDYPWSSARAHALGLPDPVLSPSPVDLPPTDWQQFLGVEDADADLTDFRRHAGTGRPLGAVSFLMQLEQQTGRLLQPQKRGPKERRCGES